MIGIDEERRFVARRPFITAGQTFHCDVGHLYCTAARDIAAQEGVHPSQMRFERETPASETQILCWCGARISEMERLIA